MGFKQEDGKTARVMPRTDLEKSEDRVGILGPQISVLFLVCSGEYLALL